MSQSEKRDLVFISKGTPDDDEFVLWLAPRLEAQGFIVFADILCLKYGDRWRQVLTKTLHEKSTKLLLCCRDSTLAKDGVQEEIGIANDLSKDLGDPRFIIPMKLEPHKKVFGMGELQRVDFEHSWADGLDNLVQYLEDEGVPKLQIGEVNPEWEAYRTRRSKKLHNAPEALISNWLRISEIPDKIRYYVPTGAINVGAVMARCKEVQYPTHYYNRGILTFLSSDEVSEHFADVTPLKMQCETGTLEFERDGIPEIGLASREAHNILMSMVREAWNAFCRKQGLIEYNFSSQTAFHAGDNQTPIGKRVPWGRQGDRRSAMLRNVAKGKVWNFGATATPSFWPYPHFKIKTRVLFAELAGQKSAGAIIDNVGYQFRLRRTVCKGWRNKQWYGRLLAFLEILSGDSAFITLHLSPSEKLRIVSDPISFTSPVTTVLPDEIDDQDEEIDELFLSDLESPPYQEGDDGTS